MSSKLFVLMVMMLSCVWHLSSQTQDTVFQWKATGYVHEEWDVTMHLPMHIDVVNWDTIYITPFDTVQHTTVTKMAIFDKVVGPMESFETGLLKLTVLNKHVQKGIVEVELTDGQGVFTAMFGEKKLKLPIYSMEAYLDALRRYNAERKK